MTSHPLSFCVPRPPTANRQHPFFRSQVSALRSQVRVFSTRYRFRPFWMSLTFALLHAATPHLHLCTLLPAPVPAPDDPYQIPNQPRPETRGFAWVLGRDALAYASVLSPRSRHRRAPNSYPVPGLLLSSVSSCHPPPEIVPLPILNTPYSKLSYATFAQAAGRFAPLHCLSLVLHPSGPRVLAHASLANVSTCQPAS